MGAARHRTPLVSLLVLVMLSAGPPPPAHAQPDAATFRQSLLDLAATLDSFTTGIGPFTLQRDVAEASPEAIEMIQQELANQGAQDIVAQTLQVLTPPPQLPGRSVPSVDDDATAICKAGVNHESPPLACAGGSKPALCPGATPYAVTTVIGLQVSAQVFEGVATVASGVCDVKPNTFNFITKGVVAAACGAMGVANAVVNSLEIVLGLNNICGGGEKEADLQTALLASMAVGTERVREASEAAGRAQKVLEREIEIALRTSTRLTGLQLPGRIAACPLASECVKNATNQTCPAGIYPADCHCQGSPTKACAHRLDCATTARVCVKTCTVDADCGTGVPCEKMPSGTRICRSDVADLCATDAGCPAARPTCRADEAGGSGQLEAVVELVQRRLQQAQAAGRPISAALGDFTAAREQICAGNLRKAYGFLENTYNNLSNF